MLLSAEDLPLGGWAQFGIAAPAITALLWVLWQWIKREREACETTVGKLKEEHVDALEHEREERAAVQTRLDDLQVKYDKLQDLIREKYVDGLRDAFHATTEAHDLVTILREELRQRSR